MKKNKDLAYRVSIVTIVVNLVLTIIKIIAGIIGHSSAMISDAIHSGSDVLSTLIVIVGIYISNKKSDREHPYGHERFECIAAIILAIILAFTGIAIGFSGVESIRSKDFVIPTTIALIAAIISIVSKEWMYHYTKKAALKLNSGALLADAWHHRSDALSSIGSFVGIAGSMLGLNFFDSLASILIALCIIKVAYDILKDALSKMLDTTAGEEIENKIIELVNQNENVLAIDDVKTRLFGSKIYVDLEIAVDANLSLIEAHKIAEEIHDAVEEKFDNCKHCMVHVNPKLD